MDKKPDNDEPERLSDELLDEYLDGDTRLSQAYRGMEQPEPPPALDRAILEQARKEANNRPTWFGGLDAGSPEFWSRWMRPATTVLTMGFCLAVVLQIMDYATLTPNENLEMQELQATASKEASEDAGKDSAMRFDLISPSSSGDGVEVQFDSPAEIQASEEKHASAPSPASAGGNMEEMVVTRRERAETLQDVPMSITAFSADEFDMPETEASAGQEIVVTARKTQVKPKNMRNEKPAANALQAWEDGARPAAKVWLAGIETLLDDDEPQAADQELARMALVYPDAATEFRAGRLAQYNAEGLSKKTADTDAPARYAYNQLEEIAVSQREDRESDAPTNLADAWVWAEGINWLHESGAEDEAEAELAKFRQVYPDFEY